MQTGHKAADGREDEKAQIGHEAAEGWDTITVRSPKRWWPHGFGEQPLYRAEVTLVGEDGEVLDCWSCRIGLRTMTINREIGRASRRERVYLTV